MDKTKIIICGIGGKMGALIAELAVKSEEFTVKAGVESKGHPLAGKEISGFGVTDNIWDAMSGGEVVIDFTVPSFTMEALAACRKKETPFVTGTTGLSKEEYGEIKKTSEKIPLFFAPNMSFGVNLFFEIIRFAASLTADYDTEVSEVHHRFKKDAPSGTAKKIAEIICESTGRDFEEVIKYGREGITGTRPEKEIGMHSLRMGDIVGEHYVYFGGRGEVIELSHRCYNRESFASGALKAARFLDGKPPGLYGMQDLIREQIDKRG